MAGGCDSVLIAAIDNWVGADITPERGVGRLPVPKQRCDRSAEEAHGAYGVAFVNQLSPGGFDAGAAEGVEL